MDVSSYIAKMIKISYGVKIEHTDDLYVSRLEQVLEAIADAFTPGKYLVEILPVLRFVPGWVPGAGFQKTFAASRQMVLEVKNALCARTKQDMVGVNRSIVLIAKLIKIYGFVFLKLDSETPDSIIVELSQRLSEYEDGEDIAKGVSLVAIEG